MPLSTNKIAFYYKSLKDHDYVDIHELMLDILVSALSETEYRVLDLLYRKGEQGVTAKEAAPMLFIHYTTAIGILRTLEDCHLAVTIKECAGNKRAIHNRWFISSDVMDWFPHFGEIFE